jgi:hypothetical protein
MIDHMARSEMDIRLISKTTIAKLANKMGIPSERAQGPQPTSMNAADNRHG